MGMNEVERSRQRAMILAEQLITQSVDMCQRVLKGLKPTKREAARFIEIAESRDAILMEIMGPERAAEYFEARREA